MALRSWKVHATRLLLAAVLVVITGWVIGLAWQVPLVVLMAYLAWHLANLWRLYRWLQIPGSAVPESIGLWSDIYERIAALEKARAWMPERKDFAVYLVRLYLRETRFNDARRVFLAAFGRHPESELGFATLEEIAQHVDQAWPAGGA